MKRKYKEVNNTANRTAAGKLELLVTIVNRKKAEYYCDFIQEYDVNMQMICLAQGTADDEILDMLGMQSRDRSVIFSVVRDDLVPTILGVLEDRFATVKSGKGIAFTIPFDSVIGVAIYGFMSNNRKTVKENI